MEIQFILNGKKTTAEAADGNHAASASSKSWMLQCEMRMRNNQLRTLYRVD